MNIKALKKKILEIVHDIGFHYHGKEYFITPHNEKSFTLRIDGVKKSYTDIDELLLDKVIDGKSITEIIDTIDIDIC